MRRLLALGLAIVMALALTACEEDTEELGPTSATQVSVAMV